MEISTLTDPNNCYGALYATTHNAYIAYGRINYSHTMHLFAFTPSICIKNTEFTNLYVY